LSWKTQNREKLEIEKTSEDEDENKKTLGMAVHNRKKRLARQQKSGVSRTQKKDTKNTDTGPLNCLIR
jgi:predicted type IV restriction endonuclease